MAQNELSASRLRLVTYNVHDCIGRDGTYSPGRIADVVAGLHADLVALQEVTLDHGGDVLGSLEGITGLRAIDGTLFDRGVGRYGNVLLSRYAVLEQKTHDLSFPNREPRGIVDAVYELADGPIRVMATHLGLVLGERRDQIARIAQLLNGKSGPAVLLGDFNVWFGLGAFEPLSRNGFAHTPVPSYPTWPLPLLPLDRILVREPAVIRRIWRHDAPLARIASDHFPLVADVEVGAKAL